MAKMVNFGLAYGMSDFGLSSRANIPRARRRRSSSTRYFAAYSGISYYMMAIKEQAQEPGLRRRRCSAASGRSRSCAARNPTLRGAGERMAINMPIQGTAADIVKIAMIRLDERLRAGGLPRAARCSRSTTSCCSRSRATRSTGSCRVLRETMEGALPLDVPLTVDVKVGDDWESMTPLTRARRDRRRGRRAAARGAASRRSLG